MMHLFQKVSFSGSLIIAHILAFLYLLWWHCISHPKFLTTIVLFVGVINK